MRRSEEDRSAQQRRSRPLSNLLLRRGQAGGDRISSSSRSLYPELPVVATPIDVSAPMSQQSHHPRYLPSEAREILQRHHHRAVPIPSATAVAPLSFPVSSIVFPSPQGGDHDISFSPDQKQQQPLFGRKSSKNTFLEDDDDEDADVDGDDDFRKVSATSPPLTTRRGPSEGDAEDKRPSSLPASPPRTTDDLLSPTPPAATSSSTASPKTNHPPPPLEEERKPPPQPKQEEDDMDEDLKRAIEESKKESTVNVPSAASLSNHHPASAHYSSLSKEQQETMKEHARTLRGLLHQEDPNIINHDLLNFQLKECQDDQLTVTRIIESGEEENDLLLLLDLNEFLLGAISQARDFSRHVQKQQHHQHAYSSIAFDTQQQQQEEEENARQHNPSASSTTTSVATETREKDIFGLIYMLRTTQNNHNNIPQHLEAAVALMKHTRGASRGNASSLLLCEEIRSLGGFQSLLAVFRADKDEKLVRLVAALSIAYMLPTFAVEMTPSLGLKILEALHFCCESGRNCSPTPIVVLGEPLHVRDILEATTIALASFWINYLEPLIKKKDNDYSEDSFLSSATLFSRTVSSTRRRVTTRHKHSENSPMECAQIAEMVHVASLIVIDLAGSQQPDLLSRQSDNLVFLVRQSCLLDAVRPYMARNGLFPVLVDWIHSVDEKRKLSATVALSSIACSVDPYAAGWVHAQIVQDKILPKMMTLPTEYDLSHDVKRSLAEILATLTRIPHLRSKVIQSDPIPFLIDMVYQPDSQESLKTAYHASTAILELCAYSIYRASVYSIGDNGDNAPPILNEVVIDELASHRAVKSFVELVSTEDLPLQIVSVKILRILSEDKCLARGTQVCLCENGAAQILGRILKENLDTMLSELRIVDSEFSSHHPAIELFSNALCCLSNIFSNTGVNDRNHRIGSKEDDILVGSCAQVCESGGIVSLLELATLPISSISENDTKGEKLKYIQEACRSLSYLALYVARPSMKNVEVHSWTNKVFDAFFHVHKEYEKLSDDDKLDAYGLELLVSMLQGFANLANSSHLQIRIVDTMLSFIVQTKSVHPSPEVCGAANQALCALQFTEDEVVAQIAGNNPNLLADWYCMRRSFMVQGFASSELQSLLLDTWKPVLDNAKRNNPPLRHKAHFNALENLLISIEEDLGDSNRLKVAEQFFDICKDTNGLNEEREGYEGGLLNTQVYPLSSASDELHWVLGHKKWMSNSGDCSRGLSEHVNRLFSFCIPSLLLRRSLFPVDVVDPFAPYDFRTILMPKRRYFSFRREGQLVAHLCNGTESQVCAEDALWTLAFTDSSFTGEFSESLVQALYLCPRIRALSFKHCAEFDATESRENDYGIVLATLIGSLPPWISHLTFERCVSNKFMKTFVNILDTIEKLSAQSGQTFQSTPESQRRQEQGKFDFLAIRYGTEVSVENWEAFINLFGRPKAATTSMGSCPFTHLKQLDLSGNALGDDLCAYLLQKVLDRRSGCNLRELDLSDCGLKESTRVLAVLTEYADATKSSTSRSRQKKITSLRLAKNQLRHGKAWLELLSMLKNNSLPLRLLDLSENELNIDPNDYDVEIIVTSLTKNTTLEILDLSCNYFDQNALEVLFRAMKDEPVGALITLSGNIPAMSPDNLKCLEAINEKIREPMVGRILEGDLTENVSEMQDSFSHNSAGSLDLQRTMEATGESRLNTPGDNMITVLFSAPLVYRDMSNAFQPFAKLDLNMERELLWQCLKEASRDIELVYDNATHDRLLATITKRCQCLHYSGHGHQQYLPFERVGETHWLEVEEIRSMIDNREGGSPFKFVFVSACFSGLAGETFASAGVPHVVCCQQDYELKDAAALAFTRQFYLAIAVGHTVQESFDLGLKAVRASPNLSNGTSETNKFLLLPHDGNHDVPIFNARMIPEWPSPDKSQGFMSLQGKVSYSKSKMQTTTRSSELSVRNMLQEDPCPSPPQFFIGREVDMYFVLRSILEKRLVNVVGEVGIGRSSLVCALCHYINERASTIGEIDHIYYVKVKRTRSTSVMRKIVAQLVKTMNASGTLGPVSIDAEYDSVVDDICKSLKNSKALLVFDRIENIDGKEDASEFPMLLSSLLKETRNTRILLTSTNPLGIPSLGGQVEHQYSLGPLNFSNTVRLFANLCSFLHTPLDRKRLFESVVTESSEAELLPNDPGLRNDTKKAFSILGDGVPAKIEKEAYTITKENYMDLKSGHFRS